MATVVRKLWGTAHGYPASLRTPCSTRRQLRTSHRLSGNSGAPNTRSPSLLFTRAPQIGHTRLGQGDIADTLGVLDLTTYSVPASRSRSCQRKSEPLTAPQPAVPPGKPYREARHNSGKPQADYLLAIWLDRVSRSVSDFAGLLDRARKRRGGGLTLLSPHIDTSDPAGQFTVIVLASAAQYERDLIGVRTREGMAQRRAEGVRLGRPRTMSEEVGKRIRDARAKTVIEADRR